MDDTKAAPLPYGTNSTLRKERKQQTRTRLVDAAVEVFRQRGLASGTIEEIAARAEVSRQTFYFHFDSKESLLLDLMVRVEERMLGRYADLAELPEHTAELATAWAENFLGHAREERGTVLLLMQTMPYELAPDTGVSKFYDDVIGMLAERIPAFADATSTRNPVRHAAALLLFFQLEMMMRYVLLESRFDNRSICQAWGAQWARFVNEGPALDTTASHLSQPGQTGSHSIGR